MTPKEKIKNYVADAVKDEFSIETDSIQINYPDHRQYGDYATPVAMSLARELKRNPRDVASALVGRLSAYPEFDKVEIAGPGFVNFFLSDKFIDDTVREAALTENFGKNDALSGRKILLEYVSANPTGPLHIGHGRWAAIGDSMKRILKFCGADVFAEFYVNDAGNQIELLNQSVSAVRESKPIPENGYHGEYIKEIAAIDGEPKDILLNMQKETLLKFRTEFDNYFSEITLRESGFVEDTIRQLERAGILYEQDGALWFRTTDFGDDKDRVLVKADGSYTYFAVDIAYHRKKIERGFDELINVFGADHHGYVSRINAAVKVFAEMAGHNVDLNVIIGQLVNLFRGGEAVRMSKRTGDMITLDEVIDEIGVDAGRYFLVMRKTDSSLDFDLEVAKHQSDDNPVFYVQYAHARISGVLDHAGAKGAAPDFNAETIIDSPEGRELALEILKFPDTLVEIGNSLEPHRVPMYLEGIAAAFHRFYHHNRVVSEDKTATSRRLVLVRSVKNILKTGLDLIGVNAPDNM
jgi:arginyl-tRNA synthetase